MKNKSLNTFLVASVICLFSACSLGLLPEWTRDSAATVSFGFGAIDLPGSPGGRAIVQGGGYLYLRTVGGPTGTSGPFYGPYTVSAGGTLTTTDLPAGSFKFIGILYSATILDETKTFTYNGSIVTFRQLMRLDDSAFDTLTSGNDSIGNALDEWFAGEVSGAIVPSVTLKAGETTNVSATLMPFTGPSYRIDLASMQSVPLPVTSSMTRKFYRLEGLSAPAGSKMVCTLTPAAGTTANIGFVALYDNDGKKISANAGVGEVSSAQTYEATSNGDSEMYLYVEYSASSLTMSFSGAAAGFNVSYTGGSAYAGKTLYFGLYDVTGENLAAQTMGPVGSLVGVGLINIDASGSGSGLAVDITTGKAAVLSATHTYMLTAFIDVGLNYTEYRSYSSITASMISSMRPHYGDPACSVICPPGNANLTYDLTPSVFEPCSEYVLFTAMAATGTGDGSVPSNAMSFTAAINAAATHTGVDEMTMIILTEDVTLTSPVSSGTNIVLMSMDSTQRTITLSTMYAAFSVTAGYSLNFVNVAVDGSAATGAYNSVVTVAAGGSLNLLSGSVIKNMALSSGSGGAVNLASGSSLTMYESSIQNCSAMNGGAVYMTGGVMVMAGGSSITGCSALNSGGGVYAAVDLPSSLTLADATCSITGNTAASGGDLYYFTTMLILTYPAGTITSIASGGI
jgi:hypothetical protein